MRLFIAIKIPPRVESALGKLINELRAVPSPARWVRPESTHITLKFLGDVEAAQQKQLYEALEQIASRSQPFELSTGTGGAFPNLKNPAVLWIGLDGAGLTSLKQLQNGIETTCYDVGFPREKRRYNPHLTLCRIKGQQNLQQLLQTFQNMSLQRFLIPVDEIHLMQSKLSPKGAVYSVVESFSLNS
ncbi:MAG: RNA 2',3'-cyclic phosphodiesterase [Calditrichia bacterium]